MRTSRYRLVEFFLIFILAPVSFTIPYPIWIKLAIGLLGFVYVVYVLLRIEKLAMKVAPNLDWRSFWINTMLHLLVIAAITIAYVWYHDREQLFNVMLEKWRLWVFILFIYSFFSVYPQELIYRTFFFQRYMSLFPNARLFILVNAAVFSLAHIFFRNTLVMILTFIGGVLFALSFQKTKSTLMVSIEHAVYGCWLFTVGMGEMLGFPG